MWTDRTNNIGRVQNSKAPAMQLAQLGTQMSRKKQELIRAGRRPTIGLMATNNFDGPILIESAPNRQELQLLVCRP